ncbi:MAG TPA: hypothetical protein VM051_06340 [Usitatibacter sp.]|nr:hypothetical protein [Usitatibacter sp.]
MAPRLVFSVSSGLFRFLRFPAFFLSSLAFAGGSNYNVTPGALPVVKGQVTEWDVPTPKFARDPAPAPDGSMFIAVMQGNKIARFDPATKKFQEWDMPAGAKPHGLVVDKKGIVFYTGNGNGTIGRLDPATGKVTEFKAPSGGSPHTIIQAADGTLWFTEQGGHIGRLDPASGVIREYETRGGPYGLAISKDGAIWFCQLTGHRMGRLDPATGKITEVELPRGSGPRRVAANADGSILWWAFYGSNELVKFDPLAQKILKKYPLPAGRGGGAYAVTVDGAGHPWVNEIEGNTVIRLDPQTEKMQVVKLPTANTGIRKMIIAADGRLWYMGSHIGKIGVIE